MSSYSSCNWVLVIMSNDYYLGSLQGASADWSRGRGLMSMTSWHDVVMPRPDMSVFLLATVPQYANSRHWLCKFIELFLKTWGNRTWVARPRVHRVNHSAIVTMITCMEKAAYKTMLSCKVAPFFIGTYNWHYLAQNMPNILFFKMFWRCGMSIDLLCNAK